MDRRGSKNKVAVYHLGVQILVTPTASSRVLARRALHGALIRPAAAAQLVWRKFEVKTRIEFVARENKSDQPQAFAPLFALIFFCSSLSDSFPRPARKFNRKKQAVPMQA